LVVVFGGDRLTGENGFSGIGFFADGVCVGPFIVERESEVEDRFDPDFVLADDGTGVGVEAEFSCDDSSDGCGAGRFLRGDE